MVFQKLRSEMGLGLGFIMIMCNVVTKFNECYSTNCPALLLEGEEVNNGAISNSDTFLVPGIRNKGTCCQDSTNKSYDVQDKIVRFHNVVKVIWIDNDSEELKKKKWYQPDEYDELLHQSLSIVGLFILAGYYPGDDDIHRCMRGLEFKLATKESKIRQNRRLTAQKAVFREQARRQKRKQKWARTKTGKGRQKGKQQQITTRKQKDTTPVDNDSIINAERIALVYKSASLLSCKLALVFGAYDAKEAMRIQNGEQTSLSVLICNLSSNLHNNQTAQPIDKQSMIEKENGRCYSLFKKKSYDNNSKCLYLENIEKVLSLF
mmetsp:Transcript_38108/g.43510  ORF Transcript_38108/g.43510 Transcript_38108/m.43510 type:complete len:320 (-) Transcript_38108:85-1044(-)